MIDSYPNHLAAVARLCGMESPPPVHNCRVLELGCGRGDNLIPMAMTMPESQFVGIDLSQRQVDYACQVITELDVTNVEIRQGDIATFSDDTDGTDNSEGSFDYIIAHGVYSWVPANVRDALLAICKKHLTPSGVAFISYNTLPGWRLRKASRDALLYHIERCEDTHARINEARSFLDLLCENIPKQIAVYRDEFTSLRDKLVNEAATTVRLGHDLLEENNGPVYFRDFCELAAENGLQYLAEADISSMQTERLAPEAAALIDEVGDDRVRREQYLDFLKNRAFRKTILCHANQSISLDPKPQVLQSMHLAAQIHCNHQAVELTSTEPMEFKTAGGLQGATDDPLTKAALVCLAEIWPATISFTELQDRANRLLTQQASDGEEPAAETLAANLLNICLLGEMETHMRPPQICTAINPKPVANRWSQHQSALGEIITNARGTSVAMSDLNRAFIALLDGTRTHDQIYEALSAHVIDNDLLVLYNGRPAQGDDLRNALVHLTRESLARAAATSVLEG